MQWPEGVAVGARVIASTSMGFWLRGTVRALGASGARVAFDQGEVKDWLPRLRGFGSPAETVTPERIAALPASAPSALPPLGSLVIVLWNQKRFHPATLVSREGASAGVVRYDEGDEEPVSPEDVLVRGAPEPSAAERLRQAGLVEGASVRVTSAGHAGWISEVGSGVVYVRYPKASHGHWCPSDELALGGRARPSRAEDAPRSAAEATPGARVSARWVDRVRYPGTVREVRSEGSELEVVWDDGSIEWVPARRVTVTQAAPPPVAQNRAREQIDVRAWSAGTKALARVPSGDWAVAEVQAVRGDDVFVLLEGKRAERVWARGNALAAPPLLDRFPAPKTGVVVEERSARGRVSYRTGRMREAVGGRAEVRLDDSGPTLVAPDVLWRRVPNPTTPSLAPEGVEAGSRVLVEHLPDDFVRGRILKLRAPEGLARVEIEGSRAMTVDLARVHPAPTPPPPPPPPPPPIRVAPPPPPSADERARRLAKLVALEWSGGGYRGISGEGGRTSLEVDVGELTLDVRITEGLFVVEVVAAGAVPGAPPIEGATVRLARFFRGLLGGRAEDTDAVEAADYEWLIALARPGVRREVARAGGALSVVLRSADEPSVSEVIAWARAVHARLFDADER